LLNKEMAFLNIHFISLSAQGSLVVYLAGEQLLQCGGSSFAGGAALKK
jgi:hypothetical protein